MLQGGDIDVVLQNSTYTAGEYIVMDIKENLQRACFKIVTGS